MMFTSVSNDSPRFGGGFSFKMAHPIITTLILIYILPGVVAIANDHPRKWDLVVLSLAAGWIPALWLQLLAAAIWKE